MAVAALTSVVSSDGTVIACQRSGSGPPLVLVSGAGSAWPTFRRVIPLFAERFTTYAVDRRGWGSSGESEQYALEREFEDVAAVIQATGEPTFLLGHSEGGVIALGAALLSDRVAKLVLYEGGALIPGIERTPPERVARVEELVRSGQNEAALLALLETGGNFSAEEIEEMHSSPSWPDRVARAHQLPRRLRARAKYEPRPEDVRRFTTPTLLLAGERSTKAKTMMEQMAVVLPNARLLVLEGERHRAMLTAPELFAARVTEFLDEGL